MIERPFEGLFLVQCPPPVIHNAIPNHKIYSYELISLRINIVTLTWSFYIISYISLYLFLIMLGLGFFNAVVVVPFSINV